MELDESEWLPSFDKVIVFEWMVKADSRIDYSFNDMFLFPFD